MSVRNPADRLRQKLIAARLAAGLDPEAAARKAGILRANLALYESGKKAPTAGALYKLAAAYGIAVDELLAE